MARKYGNLPDMCLHKGRTSKQIMLNHVMELMLKYLGER